jgi:hypothetical protein
MWTSEVHFEICRHLATEHAEHTLMISSVQCKKYLTSRFLIYVVPMKNMVGVMIHEGIRQPLGPNVGPVLLHCTAQLSSMDPGCPGHAIKETLVTKSSATCSSRRPSVH